jgi:hypothetical protein
VYNDDILWPETYYWNETKNFKYVYSIYSDKIRINI